MVVTPYPAPALLAGDPVPTSDALPITKRKPKSTAAAWSKGDPVWWNNTNHNFEKITTGTGDMTIAAEDALIGDTTGVVYVSNISVVAKMGGVIQPGDGVKGSTTDASELIADTARTHATYEYHPNVTPIETPHSGTVTADGELGVIKLLEAEKF
jgi:hypothetical protein